MPREESLPQLRASERFPKGVLGLRRGKEMEIEAQKFPLTPEI